MVRSGAPIVLSSPHFYQAEERFVEAVFGMKPNKEQHQTTIDVNPVGKSRFFPFQAVAGGQTSCFPLGGAVTQHSHPA